MAPKQRDNVQELLAASGEPLDAAEIAQRLGIHVTTARFHLSRLVDDDLAEPIRLAADGVGRPRTGYRAVATPPVQPLLGHLLGRLGSTPQAREQAAVEAGRLWADEQGGLRTPGRDATEVPDPVTVVSEALQHLGFRVRNVVSAFGVHEVGVCSCPLAELATGHPEIARGVARGVIEQALAVSSPVLAAQYTVTVLPDPRDGQCEISLRLAPLRVASTN